MDNCAIVSADRQVGVLQTDGHRVVDNSQKQKQQLYVMSFVPRTIRSQFIVVLILVLLFTFIFLFSIYCVVSVAALIGCAREHWTIRNDFAYVERSIQMATETQWNL